jgi:hypothetical protein
MLKKIILIILLIFIITIAFCTGTEENQNTTDIGNNDVNDNTNDADDTTVLPVKDNAVAEEEYNTVYTKWEQNNITSYSMQVNYNAFSPMTGIWDVVVENGEVTQLLFNGDEPTEAFKDAMSNLTMEYLFELAQKSYQNDKTASFLYYAEYDMAGGYVKIFAKIENPLSEAEPPTDSTYNYEVLQFEPAGQ